MDSKIDGAFLFDLEDVIKGAIKCKHLSETIISYQFIWSGGVIFVFSVMNV
jgi:hypothetical protein